MTRPAAQVIETQRRRVPETWGDRNRHMNEGRYGQVFSDAADVLLDRIGAGESYIEGGYSYFTVETTIRFLHETLCGEEIQVLTRIASAEGKKLLLEHDMRRASDGTLLATSTQLLLHVDLAARKSCPPDPALTQRIAAFLS